MSNLVVEEVTKTFETRAEPLQVLRGLSLNLSAGENLGIVGPSGSGKSTLLHIIGTLDSPSSGKVTIDDIDPFGLSEPELATFRNQKIGFVFQEHHLLPQFSVLENVMIPTMANSESSDSLVDRAKELLDSVGLSDRLTHRPAELSGGEKQRVAIARAMICQPAILLADEPTGSLDSKNAATIGDLLLKVQKKDDVALIVVTHSSELAQRFDRQMRIEDGLFV